MIIVFQLTRLMRGVTASRRYGYYRRYKFQLTRLMRGVTSEISCGILACAVFQLTRLMRGVTSGAKQRCVELKISTHTPHARRDLRTLRCKNGLERFQLTRLMRGVTCGFCQVFLGKKFQLTRLMRGVTPESEK